MVSEEEENVDARMTSDPTYICHAGKLVFRVDVKDVFNSHRCAKEVSASGVNDTFGLASRSRGL